MNLNLIEDTGKRFIFSPDDLETVEIVVFAADRDKAIAKVLNMFQRVIMDDISFEMGE